MSSATLTARPAGLGDGMFDDLPTADWVKVLLELAVLAVIVVIAVRKHAKQRKFDRMVAMSEETQANLSPELREKVVKASGNTLVALGVSSSVGVILLLIMWFL